MELSAGIINTCRLSLLSTFTSFAQAQDSSVQ